MNDFFDTLNDIKKDMIKSGTNLGKKAPKTAPNLPKKHSQNDKFTRLMQEFSQFVGIKKYE